MLYWPDGVIRALKTGEGKKKRGRHAEAGVKRCAVENWPQPALLAAFLFFFHELLEGRVVAKAGEFAVRCDFFASGKSFI